MTTFPNLFVVGAPKCGTTSLCSMLANQIDVFIADKKEPHYFSLAADGFPSWGISSTKEYLALYEAGNEHTWRIDGSTWYLRSRNTPQLIAELSPDSSIIVMLRDPVKRAFSSWSFSFENGWVKHSTFEEGLKREREHGESLKWDFQYLRSSLYADDVQRYIDVFGADRVKIVIAEDFFSFQSHVLDEVCNWLGLERSNDTHHEVATNVTKNQPLKRFLRRNSLLLPTAKVWHILPENVRTLIKRNLLWETKKRVLDADEYRNLRPFFNKDIDRLSEMIGRDLNSIWR